MARFDRFGYLETASSLSGRVVYVCVYAIRVFVLIEKCKLENYFLCVSAGNRRKIAKARFAQFWLVRPECFGFVCVWCIAVMRK